MAARVAWVMRATSLAGLLVSLGAHPVDLETIDAMTGDGCGQVLYPERMDQLEGWANLGMSSAALVALIAFFLPRRSLWHIPALLVWSVTSAAFLRDFLANQAGIYNCDTFAVPSDLAFFVMFARPTMCLAIAILAIMLPKRTVT